MGTTAKDGQPPVRVEDAHLAIISKREYQWVKKLLGSRARGRRTPSECPGPTCSAAFSGARAAAGPCPPPRPRVASTPTTSASP